MSHHHNNNNNRNRRSTPLADLDPALTEISRKVIGCAIETHKELGPGYPLDIYRAALLYELKHEEVPFEENKAYEVHFDGEVIGSVTADLFAGDRFLVKIGLVRVLNPDALRTDDEDYEDEEEGELIEATEE